MTTAHQQRGRIPVLTDGQRLMIARSSAGYTQRELAAAIGVGSATVQRAEQGTVTPKRAVVMAWAMATGVDLYWLETGKAPSPGGDGASMLPHLDSNQKPADKRGMFASVQVTALEDLRRRSPGILPMRQVEAA